MIQTTALLSISHVLGEESWLVTADGQRGACIASEIGPLGEDAHGDAGHPVRCCSAALGPVIAVAAGSVSGSSLRLCGGVPQGLHAVRFTSESSNLFAYTVNLLASADAAAPDGGRFLVRLSRRHFSSRHGRLISFIVPEVCCP